MTEKRRMQLHLGKCIDDLDELYNIPDLKNKRATLLCKTAQKLFEKAEEAREKGDEEYSYVYYMKYLRIVAYLSKDKEYMKDKVYFTNMLGVKNPNKAIDAAEQLKSSLIKRYELEKQIQVLEAEERQVREADQRETEAKAQKAKADQEAAGRAGGLIAVNLPSPDEVTIKADELYAVLKSGAFRVMILDARSAADFEESHLNYCNCISVPEEVISPGQSAHVLEQQLPAESRSVWAARAGMDVVVMMDWNSTTLIPGSTLFLLKTILLKWDVKVQYSRPPLALLGGYEEWLLKYPALTTNPQVLPPGQMHTVENMLNDINYPNWYDVVPPPPAPETAAERAAAQTASATGIPTVDRSSKAAAMQMYAERARYMQRLLEQQERIADSSISLEIQRIEAEKDWRRVYVQGETEQSEDVRDVYQLREQEISSQLMQLESKQYDMEQENQQLRERLSVYMRREREEAERLAALIAERGVDTRDRDRLIREQAAAQREAEEKQRRIEIMEEQRRELDRQREALENERKKKLAEARRQRKPQLRKEEEGGDVNMASPGDGQPGAMSRSESSPSLKRMAEENDEAESRPPPFDRAAKPTRVLHRERDFEPVWGNVELYNSLQTSVSYDKLDETELSNKKVTQQAYTTVEKYNSGTANNEKLYLTTVNEENRDFERTLPEDEIEGLKGRGLTGLKNLGNTCYMNSIIQCLNNTANLVPYFCSGQYLADISDKREPRGRIADELAAVVRALWSGEYRFISIKDLRNELASQMRAFSNSEQQDSHEFLTILMDFLHRDLQFSIHPSDFSHDGLTASEKAWHQFTKCKESMILRLFYGQIRSTVKCSVCSHNSLTYETFSNLSLEIPADVNRCTLGDCLNMYLNQEKITGWNCPQCKQKRDATKKLDIAHLPPVLVIHFKRNTSQNNVASIGQRLIDNVLCKLSKFYGIPCLDVMFDHIRSFSVNPNATSEKPTYLKRQTYIDFPVSGLNLRAVALSSGTASLYDLYAVSNHYGNMECGHYTAACKSSLNGKWYKYDDHQVTVMSTSEVKSSAAYILFYARRQ